MKPFLAVAASIAAMSVSLPALARDYYYFNKPGVDRQTYLEDRLTCDALAGGVARISPDTTAMNQQIWQNNNLTTGQSAAAAGIASLLIGFMSGGQNRRLQWQVERICLADKGYRRFEMDKSGWKAIEQTDDQAARIDKWFTLASTGEPEGKEMYE
ncbi:hypothetical protein [Sphingopyxis sp.]|uniref:hypothetical protein n=1 Tax=Sphingopyxis sp. TaxID=1908224 RepID=UPI003D0A1116